MRRKRLLIADDDPGMRLVLKSQLGFIDSSLELHFAVDGREALELSMIEEFDVIFMDIQMPRMTGLDATVAIRMHEQATGKSRAVIVAITGTPDECRCIAAGMDDFILKPALIHDIEKCVKKWITERPKDW